jgi:hypothetical protein
MNLLKTAIQDLADFSADDDLFSVEVTLISPDTQTVTLNGMYTQHYLKYDPSTGSMVHALEASIAIHPINIKKANPDYPFMVDDVENTAKDEIDFTNHTVEVTDAFDIKKKYAVELCKPDHMLGLIVLYLSNCE